MTDRNEEFTKLFLDLNIIISQLSETQRSTIINTEKNLYKNVGISSKTTTEIGFEINSLKLCIYEEDIYEHYIALENLCEKSAGDCQVLIELVKLDVKLFVTMLLRRFSIVNIVNSDNRGLLHYCISADMVKLLLFFGVDINNRSSAGHTPLHYVHNVDVARALIENGLTVHSKSNGGGSVLHCTNNVNLIHFFLKLGVDPSSVNSYGHTPLHLLSSQGLWEPIYILLLGGCDIRIVGRDGMNPLALANAVRKSLTIQTQNQSEAIIRNDYKTFELARMDITIELLDR